MEPLTRIPPEGEAHQRLAALERLAVLLDSAFRFPGTRIRFGLDPLIGLVPGVGDALGALIGAWIVIEGVRLGVSTATGLRMVLNLGVDALLGTVPILGDLFDVFDQADLRNVALIRRHLDHPDRTRRESRLLLLFIGIASMLICGAAVWGGWTVLRWLLNFFRAAS